MTTQREPDTSAERLMLAPSRLRWWRGKVSNWLHRQEPIPRETPDGISLVDELGAAAAEIERLRALADAAGQAAPVPPPVEGLETTIRERELLAYALANGKTLDSYERDIAECLTHDFAKVHALAERLSKEVERLTDYVENNDYIGGWRKRAEAAEAKLAVYEAPSADGEVEDAVRGLGIVRELIMSKRTHLLGGKFAGLDAALTMLQADAALIRRLSREKAEAEAREAKLREVMEFYANPEVYKPHPHGPAFDRRDLSGIARAALASSSPTKEKSDG